MRGYFGWLILALAFSLGLVAVGATVPGLPKWFCLTAVVPLVAYHLVCLWPQSKALSNAAVDSVYYYGFLVTVSELAATALEIAGRSQSTDLDSSVLYNFGAGLLATGYAVVARLHLQHSAKAEVPGSMEQAFESYLGRSGLLLDNMDLTIRGFARLAEEAIEQTNQIAVKSRTLLQETATSTVRTFETEMVRSLTAVREGVDEIRASLTDASLVARREELARALGATTTKAEELSNRLQELAKQALSGTDALQRTTSGVESIDRSAAQLTGRLQVLAGEEGALARLCSEASVASEAWHRTAASVDETASAAVTLTRRIAETGGSFESISRSAVNVCGQFDAIESASARLQPAIGKLGAIVQACERLGQAVVDLGGVEPELRPKLQAFGRELEGLQGVLRSTADSLASDVTRSTRAVGMLADNLSEVADLIIDRTNERRARV